MRREKSVKAFLPCIIVYIISTPTLREPAFMNCLMMWDHMSQEHFHAPETILSLTTLFEFSLPVSHIKIFLHMVGMATLLSSLP